MPFFSSACRRCRVFGTTVTVARQLESLSSVGTLCASIDSVKYGLSHCAMQQLEALLNLPFLLYLIKIADVVELNDNQCFLWIFQAIANSRQLGEG